MNTTTGKEQRYIRYEDMLDPGEYTIAEQIEREAPTKEELQRTLSHYSQMWRDSERAKELKSFFTALDNPTSDASWLAEEENRLAVTVNEWREHRRTKAELAEARYAASPF